MRRLSYDDIKENIEKEGYKLITNSKEYKNTKSKIKAICPNGNEWIFKYNYFQQGQRCGCNKCCPSNKRLNYDYVKNYIEHLNRCQFKMKVFLPFFCLLSVKY